MEDSSRIKRGRPRTVSKDLIDTVLSVGPAITERGAIERIIGAGAMVNIRDAWEKDPVSNKWAEFYIGKDGGGPIRRHSILAALGRIDDISDMLGTARFIAEHNMAVKDAVSAIRRARGVSKP